MQQRPIQAFLIADSKDDAGRHLGDVLSSQFELNVVPPVYVTEGETVDAARIDATTFHARHLRAPLLGEIGCALAHVEVYRRMTESHIAWALVVEDDVMIAEPSRLANRVREITGSLPNDQPVIVNLNAYAAKAHRFVKRVSVDGLWRPAVATYTTSSYLVNLLASEVLLSRQVPIRTQADWPVTPRDVHFFQETVPNATQSQCGPSSVDPTGARSDFGISKRLVMWSGLWFWRYRRQFDGPLDYWRTVLKPRVYRHLY